MEKEYRILILEDLPSDAELAHQELKKFLENFTVKVVDTEKGFVQALEEFRPDMIISDYHLPAFDGLSALRITREKSPLTPFIIFTGSINEETAVECIQAGADDYVIKESIIRLAPAVLGFGNGLLPITRLSDDFDPLSSVQEISHSLAEIGVVINDQCFNHAYPSLSVLMLTINLVFNSIVDEGSPGSNGGFPHLKHKTVLFFE